MGQAVHPHRQPLTCKNKREEKADNQNCVKPADKVEPKFKFCDFVINGHGFIMKIVGIEDTRYKYIVIVGGNEEIVLDCPFDKMEESCHVWDISDAKDGDVLAFKGDISAIIICKSPTNHDTGSYCSLISDNFINKEESGWDSTLLVPATIKQCDLLFQKIKEAGYEWNAEKKELKKIEEKPTWSGEDEDIKQSIIDILTRQGFRTQVDWLKSLKDCVTWKPSERQKEALLWCVVHLGGADKQTLGELLEELNKL